MYSLILLTINHFLKIVNEEKMLIGCFGFFCFYYISFVIITVDQIKRQLGIRVFHIPKKIE